MVVVKRTVVSIIVIITQPRYSRFFFLIKSLLIKDNVIIHFAFEVLVIYRFITSFLREMNSNFYLKTRVRKRERERETLMYIHTYLYMSAEDRRKKKEQKRKRRKKRCNKNIWSTVCTDHNNYMYAFSDDTFNLCD